MALDNMTECTTQEVHVREKGFADYAVDYIAGLLGGCAGLIFGHPFDTIKVRQQTGNTGNLLKYTYTTYKHAGISGFFKGLAFPLAAEGFRNMIFFGVYGNIIKLLDREGERGSKADKLRQVAAAGAVGGIVQSIPAVPIELVKIKLQTQIGQSGDTRKIYKGPADCIRHIFKEYGLRGCFRGTVPMMMRDGTGFCVYITSYEYLCHHYKPRGAKECPVPYLLLFGGLGGTMSWMINIPIDVVKSRMQEDSLRNPRYKGVLDCVKESYQNDGIRVFWRGLPVTCMRAFPVNAVTFAVYSVSLRWMEKLVTSDKTNAIKY